MNDDFVWSEEIPSKSVRLDNFYKVGICDSKTLSK